jgi:porin
MKMKTVFNISLAELKRKVSISPRFPKPLPIPTLLGLSLLASAAAPLGASEATPAPETVVPAAAAPDAAASAEPPYATGNWFGARESLASRGVELTAILQGDPSTNLSGGLRQGTAVRVPFQAALDLDTERLLGWKGGHLHAGLQALEGRNATDALVGDVQGFNNVDSDRFRQLSELWLEQRLFGGRLRLKLGKADANADFARVEASGEFLNSSAGYSPTIQGFPSYPDPAVSASVFAQPVGWLSLGAGVYDGATHEGCHGRTGNRGLATFLGAPDAFFYVAEAGLRFSLRGRPGRVSFGSWRHSGHFEGFDGTARRGTVGYYSVFEQRLAQEAGDANQGLDLFAQLGSSDGRFAEIDRHVSLGLSATGAIPGRDRDTAGVMITSVTLSPRSASTSGSRRESVLELFYGASLRPWLIVKPDLQYIVNPGAGGAKNALVGTLRVTFAF